MTIYDDVRNGLKEYLSIHSAYAPLVKTIASGDTFPYVVFEKSNDIEHASDKQRNTVISTLEFEINIFAKEKTLNNKKLAGRTIACEIEEHIKKYMGGKLGYKRTYDKPTPNIDSTVYRITLRYQVNLNESKNYFI
ncbi:MAG: hypothetical protein ACLUVC_02135 [Longibaculum sp.]